MRSEMISWLRDLDHWLFWAGIDCRLGRSRCSCCCCKLSLALEDVAAGVGALGNFIVDTKNFYGIICCFALDLNTAWGYHGCCSKV